MALYHHTPYVIMVWCLVKHKDNLTFLPVGKHPLGRPRRSWTPLRRILAKLWGSDVGGIDLGLC